MIPWTGLAPESSTDLLTKNFTVAEFSVSAEHPRLVAQAPKALWPQLFALCAWGLEPLREAYGGPLHVNSGYRSAELNSAVGGSATSQHVRAEAADIMPAGTGTLTDLFGSAMILVNERTIRGLGQIICYPSRGFMHVALRSARFPFPMIHVHEPRLGLHYAKLKEYTLACLEQTLATGSTFTGAIRANGQD